MNNLNWLLKARLPSQVQCQHLKTQHILLLIDKQHHFPRFIVRDRNRQSDYTRELCTHKNLHLRTHTVLEYIFIVVICKKNIQVSKIFYIYKQLGMRGNDSFSKFDSSSLHLIIQSLRFRHYFECVIGHFTLQMLQEFQVQLRSSFKKS